jgi:hypothetical protein
LQDIVELDLTPNPSYNANKSSVGDNYVDKLVSPWICPITSLEMNGRFKFVYDLSNSKVLSERAYKMLKDDDASKILEENLVILNPNETEADLMAAKMEARKARAKADKKAKKEAKRKNGESEAMPPPGTSKSNHSEPVPSKKAKSSTSSTVSNGTSKKPKSVQDDHSKSEVFKSLFSSHSSAQNKPKGNWVTYDPRYN